MTREGAHPSPPSGSLAAPEDFPLLAHEAAGDGGLVYLDSAATTQKPSCVLETLDAFYRTVNANPHRGAHRLGTAATEALEAARRDVARLVGADADEIAFTSGTTCALNQLAYGLAGLLHPGDEVAVSLLEHHSNLVPWLTVARIAGAKVRHIVPDRQGRIPDDEIDRVIGPRTRIVAVSHVSNVLGCIQPVERIVRAARGADAIVVLDCAQSVAHLPVDLHVRGADFAAFSGHKMYGPMGVGALYARRGAAVALQPLLRGGGMVEAVFEQGFTFKGFPAGLEAGTPNAAGAIGMAAAARFLEGLGMEAVHAHGETLARRMAAGLAAIPSARLYGPGPGGAEERCGIVAFNVRGVGADLAAHALDRRNVAVRSGAHCAQPLVRHLGAEAVCRASAGVYTSERAVDRFLEAVEAARQDAASLMAAAML